MKKLLATTALFGASALAISANAAPLSVTVGGEVDVQAGLTDQESAFETGAFSRELKFNNADTEIHINVEGTANNGLKYGAVIELEADVTADARAEGGNADKTYIFLESGFGRVELGNNTAAQDALSVGADSIAVATGGIDGDWYLYANTTGGFAILPDLPTASGQGLIEDATKITYYTPAMSGFSAGVSYTPDTGDAGTAAGFSGELGTDFENVFGLGVNFDGQVGGVNLAASINGEFGDSESAAVEDLSAWEAGLSVGLNGGFSLAASYGDWGESGFATGSGVEASYWTAGAAYENGAVGVSATYIDGEVDLGAGGANDTEALSIGADYDLAPGLTPYIEATFFELDAAGTTVDNEGSVVIVGTSLNF